MLPTAEGSNTPHASHTLESIQLRIQQHAERLNRWQDQFQTWQAEWSAREARLDRELALLEAASAPQGGVPPRQLALVHVDD